VANAALQAGAAEGFHPGFLEVRGWLADPRQIILAA